MPLIGFSGAPFTLASYIDRGWRLARASSPRRRFMYTEPQAWHGFLDKIADMVISAYLLYQIDAGVQVVQLFDSWVGILSPADYREFVLPYSQRVIERVSGRVPVIHFGTDTATLLPLMREAGRRRHRRRLADRSGPTPGRSSVRTAACRATSIPSPCSRPPR